MKKCIYCDNPKAHKTTSYCKYHNAIYQQSRLYNLSMNEVEELRKIEKCESCGDIIEGNSKVIDHCHTTGRVRGVICRWCNLSLGNLSESIEKMEKLIIYTKNKVLN